jgi:hypothetical protein
MTEGVTDFELLLAKTLLMGKSGIWRVFELGSRALEEGLIGSCAQMQPGKGGILLDCPKTQKGFKP